MITAQTFLSRMTVLNDLPLLAINRIAIFLNERGPYRDIVDIAVDTASLKMAGCALLANDLVTQVDAFSKDGKYSTQVLQNIKTQKELWIEKKVAENIWGLNDEDLSHIPRKKTRVNTYPLKYVKKLSAIKFNENYALLKTYNSIEHLNRLCYLKQILQKYNASLRIDSKSCDNYIRNGKSDPDRIAKLMKEMEFYHLYTDYKNYISHITVINYIQCGYSDYDQIIEEAKEKALRQFILTHQDHSMIPESLRYYVNI